MKVYWWQAGLHFEPENEDDSMTLSNLAEFLKIIDIKHSIPASPVANQSDQNPVVSVYKFL